MHDVQVVFVIWHVEQGELQGKHELILTKYPVGHTE